MRAAEFKEAIRPHVEAYMRHLATQPNARMDRLATNAKSNASRVIHDINTNYQRLSQVEYEVYS